VQRMGEVVHRISSRPSHEMLPPVAAVESRDEDHESLPLTPTGSEKVDKWADPVHSVTNLTTSVVPSTEPSPMAGGPEASNHKEKVTWGARHSQTGMVTGLNLFERTLGIQARKVVSTSMSRVADTVANRRLWKTVHGTPFQLCVSFVIMLHALLTGYTAGMELATEAFGDPYQHWCDSLEVFFTLFFLAELSLRFFAERILFIIGKDWRWNVFDSILVLLSMLDLVATESGAGQTAGARVGQILRIARFLRLMRISRVMRHLTSLRTILYAILASMTSLVWCFLLIGFFMYGFAVLIVYGSVDFFRNGMAAQDVDTAEELKLWWGGIYRAMVSLFMGISGGADWSDLVKPLRGINEMYEPMFIFYIFFMMFGVLNVVVGAFVATTSQIVDEDKEALVKLEIDRFEKYRLRIKGFFREADLDHSGTLSWEEFRQHLEDPKVKAYFQALDLDVSQAHVLFDLLDTDGSDQVTIDEFLDGCMRLKGQARNVDLNMLLFTSQKLFQEWGGFMSRTESRLAYLEKFIKALKHRDID